MNAVNSPAVTPTGAAATTCHPPVAAGLTCEIQSLGQNVHYLTYTTTVSGGGSVNYLDIRLEGSFDGDGHSITGNSSGGYWFSNWDDRNVGIFGVTQNASIQNLTITNLTVLGDPAHGSIGVLVGKAIDTDVSGVSVTGGRVW